MKGGSCMPFPTPYITNIKLLAGVPLDESYRSSIYWASAGAQQAYFASKVKTGLSWTDCMYHRETDEIRVNATIDQCEDINYVMFQNTGYGSKWFYAFATEHRYINANCTAIKIKPDILQTYYFDYVMQPCFIERQHTETDVVGENTITEPVTINKYYKYDSVDTLSSFTDWSVIMFATWDASDGLYHGGTGNNGIWSGLEQSEIGRVRITTVGSAVSYQWLRSPDTYLADILNNHPDDVGGIVAMVMLPTAFVTNPQQQVIVTRPSGSYATPFETYAVKNKKCMTYPFTKLVVTDGNGSGRDYAFEEFDNGGQQIQFYLHADQCPNQSIVCTPLYYRNLVNDITQAVVMTGFPMCSWVSDSFMSYLSQNLSNIVISYASAAGQMVGGIAAVAGSGGVGTAVGLGMVGSGAGQIAGILQSANNAYSQPMQAHGNVNNSTFFTMGKKMFEFRTMGPRLEELKLLDDYFNMYGYAIHRTATPNIAARPCWTYIKTINSIAVPASPGGCPASALKNIQDIYDTGITFWKNAADVGNYSLNNSV